MHGYNTLSDCDKREMLDKIGVCSISDLFEDIPRVLRLNRLLDLPRPYSEWELENKMQKLAKENLSLDEYLCFLGAGKYNHSVPSLIDTIVNRGEFLTSYTPYQPEMSQGLLQALYEYQKTMSAITGLEVVNSSSYDGATAMADSAWVSCAIKNKKCILVAENVWREYLEVLTTYMNNRNVEIVLVKFDELTGEIDYNDLAKKLNTKKASGFIFQSPNAFGVVEDIKRVSDLCKQADAISSVSINPIIHGILKTPGEQGVDIVTGEGQPLGMHLYAGGSSLGIFSTKKIYRKYVPGRLIGKVTDINGRAAYSLVFEDREQHVAREKATSNMCSNQALNAIRAGIYLAYVGEQGLTNIAKINADKAEYLLAKLVKIHGVKRRFSGIYFNEFVVSLPINTETVIAKMQNNKIFAGINYRGFFGLDNELLIAVTEKLSYEKLDDYAKCLEESIQ